MNVERREVYTLSILDVMRCKFVRSRYLSPWSGVVIGRKNRGGDSNPLYLILILKDRKGNTPRKRIIKILDSFWTVEIDKFDISNINQDWLKGLPIL